MSFFNFLKIVFSLLVFLLIYFLNNLKFFIIFIEGLFGFFLFLLIKDSKVFLLDFERMSLNFLLLFLLLLIR